MLISGGWQPSELIQAGLRTQQSTDSGSPLWGILQAAKLEQVVTAVEAAIASPPPTADRLADRAASAKAADMPVLQGDSRASSSTSSALPVASLGPESSPEITKSARDASARLLDVLRTHAAVHAAAGAERVSLGDMTLIAFADKNQKMAAHQANSVPHPKEADSPAGNIPNYKIKSNANDTLFLVAKTANQFLDEDGKDEQAADSRFGGS
jgi:hypothetical protein